MSECHKGNERGSHRCQHSSTGDNKRGNRPQLSPRCFVQRQLRNCLCSDYSVWLVRSELSLQHVMLDCRPSIVARHARSKARLDLLGRKGVEFVEQMFTGHFGDRRMMRKAGNDLLLDYPRQDRGINARPFKLLSYRLRQTRA